MTDQKLQAYIALENLFPGRGKSGHSAGQNQPAETIHRLSFLVAPANKLSRPAKLSASAID
jgi:hypothetical protein